MSLETAAKVQIPGAKSFETGGNVFSVIPVEPGTCQVTPTEVARRIHDLTQRNWRASSWLAATTPAEDLEAASRHSFDPTDPEKVQRTARRITEYGEFVLFFGLLEGEHNRIDSETLRRMIGYISLSLDANPTTFRNRIVVRSAMHKRLSKPEKVYPSIGPGVVADPDLASDNSFYYDIRGGTIKAALCGVSVDPRQHASSLDVWTADEDPEDVAYHAALGAIERRGARSTTTQYTGHAITQINMRYPDLDVLKAVLASSAPPLQRLGSWWD